MDSMSSPITLLIENGGLGGWGILLCAVLLLCFALERFYALFVSLSTGFGGAVESVKAHVLKREYTQAIQICNSSTRSPDLQVLKQGLLAVDSGREAMKSALSGAVLEVNYKTEHRVAYIGLIANVATLLGLLGTILGLIKTFRSIANVDPTQKAQLLGEGISEAMIATASGLIVGIAAMVIYTICISRSDRIIGRVQDLGYKLVTWVEQAERVERV